MDDAPRTPRISTLSTSFLAAAAELAERLERRGTAASKVLSLQARRFELLFAMWAQSPPTDHDRNATISSYIEFNRQALSFLAGSR